MICTAKKWIGYLEHQDGTLLGIYTANVGKGGYTIFSEIIRKHYRWRNFTGIPWCAVFLHAICIEAYGKKNAQSMLGKPHPGTRVLLRRMRRKRCLMDRTYIPKPNDIIFIHNGDGTVSHVGVVEKVQDGLVYSIEGNTVDPSGHFPANCGGAVSLRSRKLTDNAIVCYANTHRKGTDSLC